MAESSTTQEKKANTAVEHGDHDRVAMLSLHPDGSPAQYKPEIVGDKDFALAAAKRQFAEQAVSAVDSRERQPVPVEVVDDPSVAELRKVHESAQADGEAAAEKTVNALFKD
jgi:hypothetical protein